MNIDKAEHVCVFGLGILYQEKFETQNIRQRYKVDLLCDNDEKKWGKEYGGLCCISVDELAKLKNVFVIIMVNRYEGIQKQLKELGIESIPYSMLESDEDIFIASCDGYKIDDWKENYTDYKVYIGQGLFDRCKMFFSFHPEHHVVPLYEQDDTIRYIAVRNAEYVVQFGQLRGILESLSVSEGDCSWTERIFGRDAKVSFKKVSMLSQKCYETLKGKGVCCSLDGVAWETVGLEENRAASWDIEINNVPADFNFLYEFANREYETSIERSVQYLKQADVEICIVRIPLLQELNGYSEEEEFCFSNEINLNYIERLGNEKETEELYLIYGEDLCGKYRRGETKAGRNINNLQGAVTYDLNPLYYENTIYIMGQCISSQFDLMTEDTILYHIQKFVDKNAEKHYKVQSIAIPLERYGIYDKAIHSIDFRRGDMVIFIGNYLKEVEGACFLDARNLFEMRNGARMFSDQCIHVNQMGSERIADFINNEFIVGRIGKFSDNGLVLLGNYLENSELKGAEQYCETYQDYRKEGRCGAIVMNCNPYTLGHEYLINESRKKVDWLYVFVVEEDKSYFPFEDRIDLVRKNAGKYENVIILPSGKMILSMNTFSSYFQKETEQHVQIDASKDLKIFCNIIAPFFNIAVRFLGEEPIDRVTQQYNRAIKEIGRAHV